MCGQFLLCCGLSRVVIMTLRLSVVISTDDIQIVTLWNNVLHHYNLSLSVSALCDVNAGCDTLVTMIHCHAADRGTYFRLFSLCLKTSQESSEARHFKVYSASMVCFLQRPSFISVCFYIPHKTFYQLNLCCVSDILPSVSPCGLRGCKNRPAPFPGWMSYKPTKSGSACLVSNRRFLLMYVLCCYLGPLFRLCYFYVINFVCSVTWLLLLGCQYQCKWFTGKTPLRNDPMCWWGR